MKSICVFCGSNVGAKPIYTDIAREVGQRLLEKNITLIYGGGSIGLMGVVANEIMRGGGKVIGVIPHFLNRKEVGHHGVSELILVDTMHERKAKMATLADGFLTLPGGMGTLDETIEILTWAQLGLHHKPVGILNVDGYYDMLDQYFDHMVGQGFLKPAHRQLVIMEPTVVDLLRIMEEYRPPQVDKWLEEGQT